MNVDSISLFCWDSLSFNVAVVIKLDLDLFLTDFEVVRNLPRASQIGMSFN